MSKAISTMTAKNERREGKQAGRQNLTPSEIRQEQADKGKAK